ncbi:activated RNA polymerase II transcriptional coactivator p15-like [Histomonas meleagridis]|uniref:activated RNA polymerase II transcriptional coactivator p15-like n=1 Tax=Histomonas meleagridis TaxID=135588 RepID=UPI00355A74B6|nr:activated RNA polymerase II transcriptional coactivator p15-like [Histomonas meleagridis]KAH0800607.1 activated RNA polymerase II transcriptional coactivator p15-like [Histomonas meleagridis]
MSDKEEAEGVKSVRDYSKKVKKETQFVIPIAETSNSKKLVTISQFHGKTRIDIREHYLKDDEWLPTKKGINLDVDQWKKLREIMPLVDEGIEEFENN